MKIDDIIEITVIEVFPYACWGRFNEKITFTHCVDWSIKRPIPHKDVPEVGQKIKAKVFYITDNSDKPLRADISLDGKYDVDLAATFVFNFNA